MNLCILHFRDIGTDDQFSHSCSWGTCEHEEKGQVCGMVGMVSPSDDPSRPTDN